MSKNKISSSGIVYSTNPDFKPDFEEEQAAKTPGASKQKVRLRLDKKHRGGKAVTLVEGFVGTNDDKEMLGKKLKTYCGTGGSVKDGEIIIQGDNRDKLLQWFLKNGYKDVKTV